MLFAHVNQLGVVVLAHADGDIAVLGLLVDDLHNVAGASKLG